MEAALTSSLLHQWGLRQQLLTLREVFLLGSGLMAPFLESLFLSIRWVVVAFYPTCGR